MRRIKITISTIWNVADSDTALADKLLKEQSQVAAYSYMEDACHGSKSIERPTVKWEEIRPTGNWPLCSCGHSAQGHNKEGKCYRCPCTHYDGECT